MSELERLVAEQQADDTFFARPEPQSVSLENVDEYIGASDTYFAGSEDEEYSFGDEPDGVYSFLEPQKGEILVAGASWHGTPYGYRRKKCKCVPCTEANRDYQRELRARRKSA